MILLKLKTPTIITRNIDKKTNTNALELDPKYKVAAGTIDKIQMDI